MNAIEQRITEIGIVPVVKLKNPERDAVLLAEAFLAGGVPLAEITFRAAGAATAIHLMRRRHPDMLVGAGTVLEKTQIDAALAAGAQFIVTPGFDEALVQYCQEKNIPIFPGCTSATDYHAAYRYGLSVLKFFPAELSGGLAKIKALAAPFPMFRVMPTGGISLQNLGTYLASPLIAACGGSYMATPELIDGGRWEEITALCKASRKIVKEARTNA